MVVWCRWNPLRQSFILKGASSHSCATVLQLTESHRAASPTSQQPAAIRAPQNHCGAYLKLQPESLKAKSCSSPVVLLPPPPPLPRSSSLGVIIRAEAFTRNWPPPSPSARDKNKTTVCLDPLCVCGLCVCCWIICSYVFSHHQFQRETFFS